MANLILTRSQLRLVLAKNPFYKLLIRTNNKMGLDEQITSQLAGSCNSEDLQLIKLRADLSNEKALADRSHYYRISTS